ncbi:MAG: MATE family efflux transporter [Desulfovibrio sp.]|nr:MATE family efflux transporter [Desulfovibrio sp.]
MNKPELGFGPKIIWQLTWPQMLMMYILFFSGIISVWAAGQISPNVQAAMGLVTQCAMFMMVVIMSIASGATAAISQSIGMGKMLRARLYISTTVLGSCGLGFLVAVPGWFFGGQILALIQTPAEIMPLCSDLWQVLIIGMPLQYVYFSTGVMFRATRLVLPPLWVAVIVAIANLIGSLGFGLGWFGLPACGYLGLIWTSVATQAIGSLANCLLLMRSGYLQFRILPDPAWLRHALPYLLKVALPAGAAQIVWQSGYLTLFVLVASLPHDSVTALAGLTAGLRAEALLFMPGMAFSMTCSILVGNSLGEGNARRARRIGLQLTGAAAGLMTIMAIIAWPFRPLIAEFLTPDAATQAAIVSYLSFNLTTTTFSIASQVMGGIMTGAGATQYNLMIYGGTFWAVRLPLGWLLGHRLWGDAAGVFAAMAISQVIQTCIMLYVVIYRDWPRFAMKRASFAQPRKEN